MIFLCLMALVFGSLPTLASVEITGCYGIIAPNRLIPTCNAGEIIKLNRLYANAKNSSTGCPAESTAGNPADPAICCNFSTEDCQMEYSGVSDYFAPCVSQSTCSLEVARQLTSCGNTYLSESNYMVMDYTCVKTSDVLPITSDLSSSGTQSVLGNANYPVSTFLASTTGVCSVSVTCNTTITILGLEVLLQTNPGGACAQYVSIEEGGSVTGRIDCLDNNAYRPSVLYISSTNFVTLKFTNLLTTDGGRLWIEVLGDTVDIRCGTSAVTEAACTSSTSTGKQASSEQLSSASISGVVIGVILLLLLLIIAICVWRAKKKRQKKKNAVGPKEQEMTADDEYFTYFDDKIPVIAQIHPIQTLLTPRQNILAVESETGITRPKSAPKPFGHVQQQQLSAGTTLPEVRAPRMPKPDLSEHPIITVPGVPIPTLSAVSNVNGNVFPVDDENSSSQSKRKKKKKRVKPEGVDQEPKKKKKKRKKKNNDDDLE